MKKYGWFLGMLSILSCSSGDDFGLESTEFVFSEQQWQLINMTGSSEGAETTGAEMEWQEYYIFSPNSSFKKMRTRNGIRETASGILTIVQYENDMDDYVELYFEKGSRIKGGCYSEPLEVLRFSSKGVMQSMWNACDGPGLTYRLVER